ncbi:MAG: EAL domain-containing protein [bacterium]|nr:EAL domain-containing protein [bacterium]
MLEASSPIPGASDAAAGASGQVEALLGLTRSLLSVPGGDGYALVLQHAVASVPGAEAGSVVVRGDDGRYRFVAAHGFDLDALRSVTFEAAEVLADVGRSGRAVVIREPRRRIGEVLPLERQEGLRRLDAVDRIRASVAVPVVLDGEVVATFRLDSFEDGDAFDEVACRTVEAFAHQVAWVLSRLRWEAAAAREAEAYRALYADAQRRARELEVLDRLRQAVARGRELDEILRLTADAVAKALDAPLVSVFLVDDGALRLRHSIGYAQELAVVPFGQGVIGRVGATGVPAVVTDVAADPDFVPPVERVVSEIAVPLEADGEVLGVLNAESDSRVFGDDDLRLLSAIRDQVGVAVQRARLLAAVRASEARFRLLAEHARDLICLHGPDGAYTYVSPASIDLVGYAPEELVGRSPFDFIEPVDHGLLDAAVRVPVRRGDASEAVAYRVRKKDGRVVWLETSARPVLGAGGALAGLVTTSRDVTERKSFEERLRRGALYDDLTGLPNRALLLDRLAQAIERFRRHPEARYAVLFLDLDRFKSFNDSLGHAVGDALLQGVALRLRDTVRAGDTVARFGGDEFCVLLEDLESDEEAERTTFRVREALARPFGVAGRSLRTSASVGIAPGNAGYAVPSDVLRDADVAMYRAKSAGSDRHVVFDAGMRSEAVARLELEADLRQAIADGALDVAYLPVVRLAERALVGFEALARWRHPVHGPVSPDVFVPLAEASGSIVAIDRFVALRACRAMAAWRSVGHDWTLSINVSSHSFTVGDVVDATEAALAESGLDPTRLRLEVTERVLLAHPDRASEMLTRLRACGTLVQVDDFGTGYSSLAHLQRLPIDALKLDRAFVAGDDEGAIAIAAAVTQLARKLSIDVLAEGIETTAQADRLRELGCIYGQGYLYAVPLAEGAVLEWAARWSRAG